jgi:phosphoribosylpyrophosphate synthetase
MDLHQKEVQGFFSVPVDNLRASPFLIEYIQESVCFLVSEIARMHELKKKKNLLGLEN